MSSLSHISLRLFRRTPWHTRPITRWVANTWVTPITTNTANNAKGVQLKCPEKDSISGLLLAGVSFPTQCFTLVCGPLQQMCLDMIIYICALLSGLICCSYAEYM